MGGEVKNLANRKLSPIAMAAAGILLLAALWGGLSRLGWTAAPRAIAIGHGALMVSGFLGTLISLERASALEHRGFMAVPFLAGAGGLAWLASAPVTVTLLLWSLAGLGMVLMFVHMFRLQPSLHGFVIASGAACWFGGNILWLAGLPLARIVPWWAGFLVLTIVGERLELTRLRRPSRAAVASLTAAIALLAIGVVVQSYWPNIGIRLMGIALLAQALFLLRGDIIWRTIRQAEPTRYIAYCLLAGYVWLGGAGTLWLWAGPQTAGRLHDAILHALFLGFVMSMIFGHALIIFPGVVGIPIPFKARFYGHLGLLHLSLVIRIAGDLFYNPQAVRWAGLLNVAAVLIFLLSTATAAIGSRRPA